VLGPSEHVDELGVHRKILVISISEGSGQGFELLLVNLNTLLGDDGWIHSLHFVYQA
jgi:hypothetical protein